MVVLAFAGIVVALMQTLVIPLMPQLPRLPDSPAPDAAWTITATLLAAAVATPTVGRLGDVHGERRMLLTNVASAVSGFAMVAMALVLPQSVQLPASTGCGLGQSMVTVGPVLAPSGPVVVAMAPAAVSGWCRRSVRLPPSPPPRWPPSRPGDR